MGTPAQGGLVVLSPAACPGASRLACCGRTARPTFRAHRLARRGGSLRGSAARGGASSLPRQCRARHRAPRFALEHPGNGAGDTRSPVSFAFVLARRIGISGTPAGARLGLSPRGRAKPNARTSGLRETDGNGLLRRSRPMFAAADLADLLADEFACLRRRCFSCALCLVGLLDCSLLRHGRSPCGRFRLCGERSR